MPTIEQYEGKNAASLAQVYVILIAEVTDIPVADGLEISEDITSTAFTEIIPIENGGEWQEQEQEDPNGDSYIYNIGLVLNKDRQAITDALHGFSGRKVIAVAVDHNDGGMRIVGSLEQPARLSWGSSKDKLLSGKNGYRINIQCQMSHPAYYYTGNLTT